MPDINKPKEYIWVINPKGIRVEIDTIMWPELEKKGFKKDEVSTIPEEVKLENQADLNFVCTLWASNGMGRVGEEVLLALDRLGLKINIQPIIIEKEGLQERTLELLEKEYSPSKKTLLFSIPEHLEQYHTEETYLHVPWDTTKAPDKWVELINKYCKKVYPVSHFTREVFEKSGVKVHMETIKHGVRFDLFPKLKRNWNKDFVFMTCGDLSTRKGTDILLEAFIEAFPNIKDVKLIIKSNHTLEWGRIKVPKDKRIKIITDRYSHEDFLKLFKKSHCFVFPSRAEGFGLPILEAMSTGMPVILHNWGGLSMMANDRYNYPIGSSKLILAESWHYPAEYSEGGGIGDWQEPNKKELINLMKYIYQRRQKAKRKGEEAGRWVRESWDWDTPIKRMWEDISKTGVQSWGDFYNKDTLTINNVQDCANSHKELFWLIKGFYPNVVMESGCGTGEMAGYLSWDKQFISGKEINKHKIKEVIAIDSDEKVIEIAKTNLHSIGVRKVKLIKDDAFSSNIKADLIFSQGMLEHFSDEEMRSLIKHQLTKAPIIIQSVPNNNYGKQDFGNERLLSNQEYYNIFGDFDLTIYNYWGNTQSILVFKRNDGTFPKTSLIMPVFNCKEMTIKAIELIREYTKDYELIVIDNNSSDGIEKWLDEQKDIRVIHSISNLGVPRAKNLAIAIAKGDYICFIDNDVEVGEGWLDTLLDTFNDKTVGFTGHEGYIIDTNNHRLFHSENLIQKEGALVDWCAHSVFVFPRKFIRDIGLLNDDDLWCVEDVDQCCKIRNCGYVGKLPNKKVNVIHYMGTTVRKMGLKVETIDRHLSKVWAEWGNFIETRGLYPKIDIGIGQAPHPNYIHIDIQQLPHVEIIADAKKLPFLDNSIQEIRNSHLIEHFPKDEVNEYLEEWLRVLVDGGILRIICPDFKKVCSQISNNEISVEQGLLWLYGGQIDKYDFHNWGYTAESLMKKLEEHNFINITSQINGNGWLEVEGCKKSRTLGVAITHHHIMGGGENHTFQIINMIQKFSHNLEIISEDYNLDIQKSFGIEYQPKIVKDGFYDIFLNISHFVLSPPKGKKNIAVIFYPQYDWQEQLKDYQQIITISDFCKDEIKRKWNKDSIVIPPAIDINKFYISPKKKQILSVGRFFNVKDGNNKNQHILVEAFKKMPKDWQLIFVGSVQDEDYFKAVSDSAKGLNIGFKHDISFEELTKLYAESSHLWHASGYGATNPSGYEHFGMVAVEALASGCCPLVFNAGGIAQIKGISPWTTIDELITKTQNTVKMPNQQYREYTKEYSIEKVGSKWEEVINANI